MTKNPIVDKTKEYIDTTINDLINKDVYSTIYPIFGDKVDMNYFKAYQISVVEGLTDKELKTISYLAPFIKEKIKYNVKEIVRYLRFIGYTDTTYEDVFLLALHKSIETKMNYYCRIVKDNLTMGSYDYANEAITTDDYLQQKEIDFFVQIGISSDSDATYSDGLTKNYDSDGMK